MAIPKIVCEIVFILFCTTIFIQVVYYLFFFRRLAFYKPTPKNESVEYPLSVIICAKDEAENLVNNLPGILVQDYRTTHEVIVVNDNSEDESKYILEELKKTFKNLSIIELTQEAKMITGKKFPLSMGIKSAKYETLMLTDADCVPASEYWMQKMQDGYREGIEIVLGYGAYRKKAGLINKLIRFDTFYSALQYLSFALAGQPYMGVGRNLSYKRNVFIKNKGFSSINQLPSGDDDLFINQVANKNNTAIVIDPDAHTISEPKETFGAWMKQRYRHYTTSKYYKTKHQILLGLHSLSAFMVYPLLIVSMLFFNWWMALAVFGIRLLIQAIVFFRSMKQLNELDLFPYFILFDIWMFFYYLFFVPALWKKPQTNWE